MELDVFRGSDVVAKIPVGGKNGRFTYGLMNAHKIVVNDVKQYDALQVQLEDYVIRKGIKYKINTVPDLNADDMLTYAITFEGPKYTWHDKLFLDEGEAEFTYYGNALLLMQLFITNINEIDPGWSLGEIADTSEKHLVFSNVYCHEAIIIIAEAFNLEFQEQEKVITMVPKIGRDTNLSFEYGMGKGLYNLTRTYVSDKNVVTKVYGFGGDRNLPVGYRPGKGKPKLRFNPGYHTHNTELYGIKEGQYTNSDIIPEREASVTAVTFGNPLSTIQDLTLDFNIKDCVIEGLEPKIGFTSGSLSGEEFVITDYNPTTKTITYKGFINDNNIVLPNDAFRAVVGDKYVLFDIELPASYVTAKEAVVDAETLQYVIDNSVPRVEYGGTIDPIHMRDNAIELMPGDRVNFKDSRVGLDATIRITEISMPLDFPEVISDETSIEITIANFVTYSAQQRLRDEKLIQRHEVKTIDIRSAEQARRNSANLLNLRDSVIDPEGNYYTEKIKPGSIETLFLSIGAKATNFNINGVSFEGNAGGNPNSFIATVGQLIHYDLELPDKSFVWEMQPYTITGLVPANKYYLYAKISKVTNVGSWELSTEVKLAESVAGYYILQAGVLFPVKDGRRDNAITKGMVFIVGDQITAGRMQSIDQSMFIDLTTGQLKLGDDQYGMDWNVTTPKRLTIRGGITQNAGGITAPITLFRGPYMPLITYYNGDSVCFEGSKYVYSYPTPIFNVPPTNSIYWILEVSKGDTGATGIPGLNGTNGTPGTPGSNGLTSYFHVAYADSQDGTINFNQSGGKFIGTYVDYTAADSNNPALYNWVLVKGADGEDGTNGIPGANGASGETSYLHIKYSDDGGASFTANAGETPGKYLGQYVDFTLADSNNVANYTWSLIKGADGANGSPGTPGAAGNFTEFRFAKNGSTTEPPSLPATDANPSGWSTSQPFLGAAEYAYITSAVKTSAGSLVSNWATPVRYTAIDGTNGAPGTPGVNGATGPAGATGSQGPFMNFRGDFDPAKSYVGSSTNIQAVRYLGVAYITRTDAGTIPTGTLPTNTSYWNQFGGQFESLATGLLLADLAFIKNLGVENFRTDTTGKRIEMLKSETNICYYNSSNEQIMRFDDDAVIESIKFMGGVPVISRGPGLIVGMRSENGAITDTVGVSTIGRTGVFTTGSVEVSNPDGSQRSAVTKTGIETTGGLLFKGAIKTYEGSNEKTGKTVRIVYPNFVNQPMFMQFVNGILVDSGSGA